ncbi:MAG: site-2 protease family protein [Actinomycetota bacterium]|nr:site-2 protease family protein [Actinomycetota bacterium]
MSLGIIIFVVAILLVVMIHESGHFLVAKAFDFKATKFFLGFGPTLWSFTKGETEYGVKAIPAGGFVKIVGMNPYEEVPPEDEERSYPNKPRWQRALVLVAGSGTHFIVAFLILWITAMTLGYPTGGASNKILEVQRELDGKPTAAALNGFQPGDTIVGVGNDTHDSWGQIRSYIRAHPNDAGTFTVEHDGDTRTVTVTLGSALFRGTDIVAYAPPGGELRAPRKGETLKGFLGVNPEPEYGVFSVGGGFVDAGARTWDLTTNSVVGIGRVFSMVFGGELWHQITTPQATTDTRDSPLGLVGAAQIAGQSVQKGRYLDLIALIVGFTVFVGLMNLLPLPPLDGGHLAVLVFERITNRTVDMRKLIPLAAAVISFFVLLFVAVLYLNIAHPIKLPF